MCTYNLNHAGWGGQNSKFRNGNKDINKPIFRDFYFNVAS